MCKRQNYACFSHFRGMSWYSSLGSVRRIVSGRIPLLNSKSAMSIGPAWASGVSTRSGAPIAICKDLAPTIRASSKRVSFVGPILTWFISVVILERSCARRHSHTSHASHSAHSTTAWRHWRRLHLP